MRKLTLFAAIVAALIASPMRADDIDGSRTSAGDGYGAALFVQTVETQFGDSMGSGTSGSEIDAVYAYNDATNLYLMFTGNLENNFNKFEIFFDSIPAAGENVITNDTDLGGNNPTNDGWANRFAGFTFDSNFAADFLVICRNGTDGTPKFDVDFNSVGNTSVFESLFDVFGGSLEGSDGTLPNGIVVGFDNTNTLGVAGGDGMAADQVAAAAVETGVELKIPLSEISAALGDTIKICAFINGVNHDFASNQFMAPLAAPQGNLGGDGMGNFTNNVSGVDLTQFDGDQFFEVTLTNGGPTVISPSALDVTEGDFVSGGIPELEVSDNMDLTLRRRNADLQSRTEFEVKSTSPTATPTVFEFTLEGNVFARGNVVQTIELFDYGLGAWELVDTTNANRSPMPDKVVVAAPTGDLSRFVNGAGLNEIAARILYKSDRNRQKFSSNTDQAVWTIQ